jgi:hypothetical protein
LRKEGKGRQIGIILQPAEGEGYRIIGDVYVDGLMFGEAYEGINADEVDYDIELI